MTNEISTDQHEKRFDTSETGIFRVVIQQGSMINNDDYFFYTEQEVTYENLQEVLPERFRKRSFNRYSLVFCRPVLRGEVWAGLDTNFSGPLYVYDEEDRKKLEDIVPDVSRFLDEVFKIRDRMIFMTDHGIDYDEKSVVDDISSVVYDCMSGGASDYWAYIMALLVTHYKIDLQTPVYPASENIREHFPHIKDEHLVDCREEGSKEPDFWYTVQHFLDRLNLDSFKLPGGIGPGTAASLLLPPNENK